MGWSSGRTSRATHIGKDSAPFPLGGGFNSNHLHPNLPSVYVVFHWNSNPSCEGLISWSNTHTHTQKPCVCLSEPRFGRANAGAQTQHTHTHKKLVCACLNPAFRRRGTDNTHTYTHTHRHPHPHRHIHTDTPTQTQRVFRQFNKFLSQKQDN